MSLYKADTLFKRLRYTIKDDTLHFENDFIDKIYMIKNGRLILNDLCNDCYVHIYKRAELAPYLTAKILKNTDFHDKQLSDRGI